MKKTRIVKTTFLDGHSEYEPQVLYLWFFWRNIRKPVSGYGCNNSQHMKFDNWEDAYAWADQCLDVQKSKTIASVIIQECL